MAKHLVMQVEVPYIEDGKSEFWQVWSENKTMAIIHRCPTYAQVHYCRRDEWKGELTNMMRRRGVQDAELYSSIGNA